MTVCFPVFLGERLTEIRSARGLTQVAVANEIKISKNTISSYESGRRIPARDILCKLASFFKVPVHYFLLRQNREDTGTIFYRSLSAATKAGRIKAEAHYNWLKDIVNIITDYVLLPTVNIPNFKLPSDPIQIENGTIDEVVGEIKSHWDIPTGPINNLVMLLESKGCIIVRRNLGTPTLDAFSSWSDFDKKPYCVLNRGKSAVRSRFDLAHELGHIILHRNVPKNIFNNPTYFSAIEQQANYFSAGFLLSETGFLEDIPYRITLDSLVPVKSKWKVSLAAIIMRLNDLSILSPTKKQSLFLELSRRWGRKQEPLDDYFEYEEPTLFKKAFGLLAETNIDYKNLIYTKLGLSLSDVEDSLGLEEYLQQKYSSPFSFNLKPKFGTHRNILED